MLDQQAEEADPKAARTASRGLPTGLKVLLWVLVPPLLLAGAGMLWLTAAFSGGIDDIGNKPGPFATDAKVVQAREAGHVENRKALDGIVAGPISEVLGTPKIIARATNNNCQEGSHDYLRDDSFDLSCTLSDAVVIVGNMDTFRGDMLALHTKVTSTGNYRDDTSGLTLSRAMLEYWDNRLTFINGPNSTGDYTPHDLPSARYDTYSDTRLGFDWTDSTDTAPTLPSTFGDQQWLTPDGQPLTAAAVPARIKPRTYGLIIEREINYFEE